MAIVEIEGLAKSYRIYQKSEGLWASVRGLVHRRYRTVEAVRGIDLTVEQGEFVAFLGPNGAGKTTTLKLLSGVISPSGGEARVMGHVPWKRENAYRRRFALVMGQKNQLWWDLPAAESFRLHQQIYRIEPSRFEQTRDELTALLDVRHLLSQPVRELSLGERMKMELIAALLHSPDVLFLDEPTIGLDVSIKAKIRSLVAELNAVRDTTIILTTHDLGDIEALCERTIIIDRGSVLFDGPTRQVTTMFGAFRTVRFQIDEFTPQDAAGLREELAARFGAGAELEVQCAEPGWADVTLDQQRTPLSGVLAFVMERRQVNDVRIVEIEMEHVVQRVYEGALAAGRPT